MTVECRTGPLMMPTATPDSSPKTSPLCFAIIGNPNTGKSSLFNALTGGNAAVGNYAGVTVELKRGKFISASQTVELIDLPGTYSLTARSLDEKVSVDTLSQALSGAQKVDGVVVVIDATAIERNLYLFSQIRESGLPVILVANMWDRLGKSGVSIDLDKLRERLCVPIVTTCASRRQGIDSLKQALVEIGQRTSAQHCVSIEDIFPDTLQKAVEELSAWFQQRSLPLSSFQARRLLLDSGSNLQDEVLQSVTRGRYVLELKAELQRLLSELNRQGISLPNTEAKLRYGWIRQQLSGIVERVPPAPAWEDRIDKFLTHRWYGLLSFIVLMLFLFQLLYSPYTTGYASGLIETAQGWLQETVSNSLSPGPLRSLINDGVIAGIGAVLVFIPQIAVLFLLFAFLEDCGYMARVAMVMDRLMTRLGLNGKAFLPLMTSFGCAVPGLLATRTIANRSDRLLTMLVAPLMSCSARLPVYTLMTYAFVPDIGLLGGWLNLQSVVLLSMMMLGAVVAIPIAWLLRRFVLPGEPSPFVLELPAYKLPSFRVVFNRVRDQVLEFVKRAGTLIFATAVIVWALLYFPGDRTIVYEKMVQQQQTNDPVVNEQLEEEIQALNGQLVRQSILGRTGIALEPVFRPLGWDWRIGVGVLASFPAREVVIATMGTIFSLGGDVDEESPQLRENLRSAVYEDRPLMNVAVALSIMVFFALCMQCAATLAVMYRESRSWKWPLFTFAYMTILAYLAAMVTYQIAIRFLVEAS